MTQYEKKFIEVQIYARREFLGKTEKSDIYLFNMNRFINQYVSLQYDIKNSKSFLSSLIEEILNTKETFIQNKELLEKINKNLYENNNNNNLNQSMISYSDYLTNATKLEEKHSNIIDKSLIERKNSVKKNKKNTLFVLKDKRLLIIIIRLLFGNLNLIKKIELLKFTYKYFIDYRFCNCSNIKILKNRKITTEKEKESLKTEHFDNKYTNYIRNIINDNADIRIQLKDNQSDYSNFYSYYINKLVDPKIFKRNSTNQNNDDAQKYNSGKIDNNEKDKLEDDYNDTKRGQSICNFTELLQNTTIIKNNNNLDNLIFNNLNTYNTNATHQNQDKDNKEYNDFDFNASPIVKKKDHRESLEFNYMATLVEISKIEEKMNQSELNNQGIYLREPDF